MTGEDIGLVEPDKKNVLHVYSEETCGAHNYDTEKVDNRKIKVDCPSCNRRFAALCSSKTKHINTVNHGYEYDDWFSYYETTCVKCGATFKFAVTE